MISETMTEKVLPAPLPGEVQPESLDAESVCPRCKRRFKSVQGLKTHMGHVHKSKARLKKPLAKQTVSFDADKPLALLYPNGVPAREADLRTALALVDQFKAIGKRSVKKSR